MQRKKPKKTIDFPNDPALQELHDIGRKMTDETRGMTWEQEAAYYDKKARKIEQDLGYRRIPAGRGAHRLVKARGRHKSSS
jgi:hypothetical protein